MICKRNYIKLSTSTHEGGDLLEDCIEISKKNTFIRPTYAVEPSRYLYFTFSNKPGYTNDETYKPY